MSTNFNDNSDFSSNLDSYHSFLQSLIGEDVQVYRGGPESKTGKLLDVQSDYITLYAQNNNNNNNDNNNKKNNTNSNSENDSKNNQNSIVYYRTQHLQSISENSKYNSMPRFQNEQEEEDIPFQTGYDFNELVEKLSGTYIQINQGGPESKTGLLLDVSGNYVALLTEDDGVVFYNVQHMKSISEYNQNNNDENDNSEQEIVIPEYIEADDFHNLFGQMSHKWVSINRGGPEALEGILVQSAGGHYTLINNDEVLRINPYHIKSISCGPKGALKQNNDSNEDDQSSQDTQNSGTNQADKSSNTNLSSSSSRRSSSDRRSSSSRRSSSEKRSSSSRRSSSDRRSSSERRSSSDRRRSSSSSSNRRSGRRRWQRSSSHGRIIKTLDYVWNPKS